MCAENASEDQIVQARQRGVTYSAKDTGAVQGSKGQRLQAFWTS